MDAIAKIESLGGKYDPSSTLTLEDQLAICEILEPEYRKQLNTLNENADAYENVNGGRQQQVNTEITQSKQNAIDKLKTFNYRTSPRLIAKELQTIFPNEKTLDNHWLNVAQRWNPRTINRVIVLMVKQESFGWKTIVNPAAYFTFLIKSRQPRRDL